MAKNDFRKFKLLGGKIRNRDGMWPPNFKILSGPSQKNKRKQTTIKSLLSSIPDPVPPESSGPVCSSPSNLDYLHHKSSIDIFTPLKQTKGQPAPSQQVITLAAKLDNWSSIPRTHVVKRENWLPKVVPWPTRTPLLMCWLDFLSTRHTNWSYLKGENLNREDASIGSGSRAFS